jgi:hypothetical protein
MEVSKDLCSYMDVLMGKKKQIIPTQKANVRESPE